jgi:hypothetical protein
MQWITGSSILRDFSSPLIARSLDTTEPALRQLLDDFSRIFTTKKLQFQSRKDWHSSANGAVLWPILGADWHLEILPRRLDRRGGASVVRREAVINRTEDLDVKICEEAINHKI